MSERAALAMAAILVVLMSDVIISKPSPGEHNEFLRATGAATPLLGAGWILREDTPAASPARIWLSRIFNAAGIVLAAGALAWLFHDLGPQAWHGFTTGLSHAALGWIILLLMEPRSEATFWGSR